MKFMKEGHLVDLMYAQSLTS